MDTPTAAAVIMGLQTVGRPVADVTKDLIVRLLGPSVDIAGEALRNWVERRIGRGQATVIAAGEMVADVGLTIRPVPGRILIPLLQAASLEEDDGLQKRWAALLANAATEERGNTILPAYVEILRQLTPAHVLILDWIYENARQPSDIEPSIDIWRDVQWDEVSYRFGIDRPTYTLLASDLHRLQVIDGRRHVKSTYGGGGLSSASTYEVIGLTPLGVEFIRACRPPSKLHCEPL